jgi:glycosyltransferase involved in cell wall biosynthesis
MDKTGAFGAGFDAARLVEQTDSTFQFAYVFPTGSQCSAFLEPTRNVHFLPFVELSKRPKDLILYLPRLIINGFRLARLCRKDGYSLIISNDLYNLSGLAALIFRRLRHIAYVRRMPEGFPKPIYRSWIWLHQRFSNQIVCVSAANAKAFHNQKKVRVIYDPLPQIELLPPNELRHSSRRIKVGYFANYIEGKGQNHALKAWEHFCSRFPMGIAELHFYGGDLGQEKNRQYKSTLEKSIEDAPWSQSVYFHPMSNQVERDMKECDVILNLSDSESFSRVTLEALFFGLPIVATDVGGTSEMFDNGYTGILVDAGDIIRMSQAIEVLVLDPAKRESMGKAARFEVRRRFGNATLIPQLLELYSE